MMPKGVGRFFSGGGQKEFSGAGEEVVKFRFSLSKLRKQPFLLKISQEDVKFQNPRGVKDPLTPIMMSYFH